MSSGNYGQGQDRDRSQYTDGNSQWSDEGGGRSDEGRNRGRGQQQPRDGRFSDDEDQNDRFEMGGGSQQGSNSGRSGAGRGDMYGNRDDQSRTSGNGYGNGGDRSGMSGRGGCQNDNSESRSGMSGMGGNNKDGRSSMSGNQYGRNENSSGMRSGGRDGSDNMFGSGQRAGAHAGKGPKGWQRSDERMQEEINEALARDEHLDASEIEVKASGGEVTLTGTVTDRESKRMAEDVVERVFGVTDVHNQIRVSREGADTGASGSDRTSAKSQGGDREVSRATEKDGKSASDTGDKNKKSGSSSQSSQSSNA